MPAKQGRRMGFSSTNQRKIAFTLPKLAASLATGAGQIFGAPGVGAQLDAGRGDVGSAEAPLRDGGGSGDDPALRGDLPLVVLALVAVAIGLVRLAIAASVPIQAPALRTLAIAGIGSLAGYWLIERTMSWIGGVG